MLIKTGQALPYPAVPFFARIELKEVASDTLNLMRYVHQKTKRRDIRSEKYTITT
jgi:hypothetical protein